MAAIDILNAISLEGQYLNARNFTDRQQVEIAAIVKVERSACNRGGHSSC
jgi:hypothetical protein